MNTIEMRLTEEQARILRQMVDFYMKEESFADAADREECEHVADCVFGATQDYV